MVRVPADAVKSTPLTTSGGNGDAMSREIHPDWSATLPLSSLTLKVTMPRADGTAIQRTFCASSQLASAPGSILSVPATAAVAIGPPASEVLSNRYSLPVPVTATISLSWCAKTSGDEVKFAAATVAELFGLSVFDSSAITWFDRGDDPAVVVM